MKTVLAGLLSCFLLAGCADPYRHGAGVYTQPVAKSRAGRVARRSHSSRAASAHSPIASPASDLDQGDTAGVGSSAAQLIAATLTARRFLGGYLPYTYGQLPAGSIVDVTLSLRATLAAAPPSVTPAERALRPRVTDVAANGGQSTVVSLLAAIDDGRETYTVPLTVTQQADGRWLVSAVS